MFHLTTALDPASDTPLYEQLYESLAEAMRAGELRIFGVVTSLTLL